MKEVNRNDEFLRKRQERQKKIRKRRLKIFFAVFLLLLIIIGVILSLTVLFPIKSITAKGSKIYTPDLIVKACGIEKGDNLFLASETEALTSLKSKLPFIESVEFDRSLPDTLNIKVTDAKEYICYQVGNKYFTVSQSGWVLSSCFEKPENVILVICDKVKCEVGQEATFTDDTSRELADSLTDSLIKYDVSVDYVDITDTVSLKAKVDGRFIVNFGSSKDLEPKVKHLVTMMEKIGEKGTGTINLSMWNSQNTQGTFVQSDIK